MPRVVHFEIPAADPQRVIQFYADVFGWQSSQFGDNPYWRLKTGDAFQPGIDGAVIKKFAP